MPEFAEILKEALSQDAVISLVLSKPLGEEQGDRWTVRPIELRGDRHYQWAMKQNGQELHENLSPSETQDRVVSLFGNRFAHAHLFTSTADYSARVTRKGKVLLQKSAPTQQAKAAQSHNRSKAYLIPENEPCEFLAEIGVMTPAGKVKANRYKKFRQINRFLELVNDIVPDLPANGILKVVDFGCGKSYLTFALHHLLSNIHRRDVEIIGLDRKTVVVKDCQRIANRLHCQGLEFREGDIVNHQQDGVDLAVSLHACDTATDEALAQAVRWRAKVILAVPCCQHELATKLPDTLLPSVQRHGILKDRLAAILTDTHRANVLEQQGYKTQIVEFIDLEHTAKNLLIRAVHRGTPAGKTQASSESYQLPELAIDRLMGTIT